jgi:uncharacterized protein YdaU (DUF1376 family)
MARSPIRDWMPFEIDRFFASSRVQGMKDFQRWWYVSLLLRAWQSEPPCRLPDDDNELRIAAGAPDEKIWAKHSALVLGAFHATGDGHRVNRRQLEIYEEKMGVRAIKKANGRGGGRPRKTEQKPNGYESVSGSSSSESISEVVLGFELPAGVPKKAWIAFEEMRQRIGKPLTPVARKLAAKRLKEVCELGLNPEEVIYESVLNSWPSFYPPRDMQPKHSTATVGMHRGDWRTE